LCLHVQVKEKRVFWWEILSKSLFLISSFLSHLFPSIFSLSSTSKKSSPFCFSSYSWFSSSSSSFQSHSFEASRVSFKLEDRFFLVYLLLKKGNFSCIIFCYARFYLFLNLCVDLLDLDILLLTIKIVLIMTRSYENQSWTL